MKLSVKELYGEKYESQAALRIRTAVDAFSRQYGSTDGIRVFSAPGRTEVGGNHTDHNRGKVLAAAIDLDVIAVVRPEKENIVRVKSLGFPEDVVDLSDLSVKEEEKNTSAALIRGVAAGFKEKGFNVCGFTAYTTSAVLKGSGLSSSAAFEVLIGTVFSGLANEEKADAVEIAKIAQYAENVYFGKPSGLMDQMASSVGGFITIDFKDTGKPVVESVPFDISGYDLCIVDTKADHADLTPDYAAIPTEMKAVAQALGGRELRDVSKEDIYRSLSELRRSCGDRAVARAFHFFDENERVTGQAEALRNGDIQGFFDLVNESGRSSFEYLQNVYTTKDPAHQAMVIALYAAKDILGGDGAARVHGGGFAGTIQAFVPKAKTEEFSRRMEEIFGKGSCIGLNIRSAGGTEIIL
ncbi:MAG: galactokinase [Oscillospiraceae bacterium]|nr:galactokinase [Oscillospiraceae bacterium]